MHSILIGSCPRSMSEYEFTTDPAARGKLQNVPSPTPYASSPVVNLKKKNLSATKVSICSILMC